jgi:hypothetical protein
MEEETIWKMDANVNVLTNGKENTVKVYISYFKHQECQKITCKNGGSFDKKTCSCQCKTSMNYCQNHGEFTKRDCSCQCKTPWYIFEF